MNNIIIGQSGGPTRVINASLVGVVKEAKKNKKIGKILGMRHGITGLFNDDLVDLRQISDEKLDLIANTPGSALGSCRHKPTSEDCEKIFEAFSKHEIKYWFYIGGNDSAETVYLVSEIAKKKGYDFKAFHIPKTIDNDLCVTDHCPGYASAAKYVAECFLGNDLDNRALKGVKIDIVMGRNAGWLTAASALARFKEDAGPHLIYLPEHPKSLDTIVEEIDDVYAGLGRCVVAVSEGIGAGSFSKETDSHGNMQLSGSGALGDMITEYVKAHSRHAKLRIRTDTLGYAQRSFPAVVSKVDFDEAYMVGKVGLDFAVKGKNSGSVYIERVSNNPYKSEAKLTDLKNVARVTKNMPAEFIDKEGNWVTEAFLDYARPIVGEISGVGVL
ncbi:MAG: phosphofructokinase, 6-phosphofructokinase [Candidatus Peregrinibacteria bacterium GW2011_GWF2_43_17]|nr:MAG: phosphofructokinase, 6-phosphofructokinase [Candidatus Peregrinibacteria bacterium GW2011_GWF2_43_17]KKT19347.1 MAG: 6-phosphofructokinase [Candidatus Peregrinibacteria bacterium GW2011_GWA2_43_8]HAU40148.1 6-phosphofructokinase [Candidatus Peregrinibacteria bacterium]